MRFEIALSELQQRCIAVALAVVPLLGVIAATTAFVSAQIQHHDSVTIRAREIAQQKAVLEMAPQWEQRLASLKASSLWRGLFLPPGAVAANGGQQGHLMHILLQNGATVERNSTVTPETAGAQEIDESASFTADISTLTKVLTELRTTQPLSVIRRLSVEDLENGATGVRSLPNQLHVELTTAGFRQPS
jgi:hypothetical protein